MDRPCDEMAFCKQHEDLLLTRKITTVFLPGIRVHPHRSGYITGEVVTARVIEHTAAAACDALPVYNDIRVPVQITRLVVMTVDGVGPDDFEGSSPDVRDRESLRTHLAQISHGANGGSAGTVTRVQFRYLG